MLAPGKQIHDVRGRVSHFYRAIDEAADAGEDCAGQRKPRDQCYDALGSAGVKDEPCTPAEDDGPQTGDGELERERVINYLPEMRRSVFSGRGRTSEH